MDWFRAAVSSIALLGVALGLFFAAPVLLDVPLDGTAFAAWTFLRVAVVLGAAYALSRGSARPDSSWAGIGSVVAAPTAAIGGGMGLVGADAPGEAALAILLVAALVAACLAGARAGGSR